MEPLDVVVIGGGPAGLSCAVRAGWTRATNDPWRAHVLLIDPCRTLGGMARWRPVMTYGPTSFLSDRQLQLLRDSCEKLEVEIVHEEVLSIERAPAGSFLVSTRGGMPRAALAVVLATGLWRSFELDRQLHREGRLHYLPGINTAALSSLVQRIEAAESIRRVAVVGLRPTRVVRELLSRSDRFELVWIEQPTAAPVDGPDTVVASVLDITLSEGAVRLQLAPVATGGPTQIDADLLVLDSASIERECATTACVASLKLERSSGFVVTDRQMRASLTGVFAAGDVTGPPFGAAKALGEGMIAGLSAFAYAFEKRRRCLPDLFPYYAPVSLD